MDGGGGYPSNASASASASAFATYSTTSGVGVGSSGDSHSNGNGLSKEVEGILLSGSDRLGALTPTASGGKGMSVMPPSLATLTLTTGGLGEAVCVQAVGQDAPPRKRGRPRKYPLGLPATSGTTTAPTAPAPSVPSALHGHSTRGKRRLKPKPRAEEALSDTPHPVTDPTDPHAHTHAYMQSQVLQQMQMMRPYGALVFGGSREGREGEGEGREGVVGEGGGGVEGGEDFSLLGEDMGGDMEDGFDVFGMLEDFE
ncbi:hypothetical protein B484DRAFT_393501 [Ochromonadaceae sp. CCMP2298]|nr:hypothetical protein B484DRAFT_393501 [Ochromonadaceae sp. CCMP2298]